MNKKLIKIHAYNLAKIWVATIECLFFQNLTVFFGCLVSMDTFYLLTNRKFRLQI